MNFELVDAIVPDFEKSGLYCKIMVCDPHYFYSPIIRHFGAIIKSNCHFQWKP